MSVGLNRDLFSWWVLQALTIFTILAAVWSLEPECMSVILCNDK